MFQWKYHDVFEFYCCYLPGIGLSHVKSNVPIYHWRYCHAPQQVSRGAVWAWFLPVIHSTVWTEQPFLLVKYIVLSICLSFRQTRYARWEYRKMSSDTEFSEGNSEFPQWKLRILFTELVCVVGRVYCTVQNLGLTIFLCLEWLQRHINSLPRTYTNAYDANTEKFYIYTKL